MWRSGDLLRHRFNPDLGVGRVVSVQDRTVAVEFPDAGSSLRLSVDSEALVPVRLEPGRPVRILSTGEKTEIEELASDGSFLVVGGRRLDRTELWPLPRPESPLDRLSAGHVDPIEDLANRLEAGLLTDLRESGGLGSFLGGRIRLFPHQLHVAERACRADPVRWLLADEVGLGKTVEACLILSHLLRTGKAESVLVVAPANLTVQWLGELWRKFHQVFVLLDEKRRADVARELGPSFNPFEAHHRVVVDLETLVERPDLAARAAEAAPDLLVVDEAHHLHRPPGHPGDPAYRAVAPLAAAARHTLLLTATPLEDDAHGFFRLLQLLRPEELPEDLCLEERLRSRDPLPPCTSATRRADIGGLPPRIPKMVESGDPRHWAPLERLVATLRRDPPESPVARRTRVDRLQRSLSSPEALLSVLRGGDEKLRELASAASARDPRLLWLAGRARAWHEAGEKTLIFVAYRETLEALRPSLERAGRVRVGVYHEDLSPGQRDIAAAQFRWEGGPSLLIATECGGEGRNFEFCRRLVLYDLPWNPALVEQRIGRLDRIGRDRPTEVLAFQPPSGLGSLVVDAYESIGVFREPLGSLARSWPRFQAALEEIALFPGERSAGDLLAPVLAEMDEARTRIREAAYHELHREPYEAALAGEILSRVPPDLDELHRDVVLAACERLGLSVEQRRGGEVWHLELGPEALVDHLPGVPGGSRYLGSFDRAEAVEDESLDFFSSGHPLVEGILSEIRDGGRGRTAFLELEARPGEAEGFGLLAFYRRGHRLEARAVDLHGQDRPGWTRRFSRRPFRFRRVDPTRWTKDPGWAEAIRLLSGHLIGPGTPEAVAAVRVAPARSRDARRSGRPGARAR